MSYTVRIDKDLDNIGEGGGGGGTGFTAAVANYSALPAASGVSGAYYWASAIDVVGGVKYPAGAYRSNGTTWEFDTAYTQAAIWGYVANYAALPLGVTVSDPQIGDLVGVNASQGTWILGTQRREGYYKRSAMTGVAATDYGTAPFAGFSQAATQAQVNTGTDTDTFVSPYTFKNSTLLVQSISGTSVFDFGNEGDEASNIIANVNLTNANFKSFTWIPIETTATSIDDFKLNAVSFVVESITDSTNFTIRGVSDNNATGNYTISYIITY